MTTAEWEPEGPSSRRRIVVAVAVVPWLALGVLVAQGGRASAPTTSPEVDPASVLAASPTATAVPRPAPSTTPTVTPPAPGAPDTVVASGGLSRASLVHVVAVALASARDHLGGAAPALLGERAAPADRYVEHLHLEALDHPAPGAAVAVVAAIVLHRGQDGFDRAELVRLGVPLLTDGDTARLAGTPWRLPPADLEPITPSLDPVDDPDLLVEAAAALTAAGYRDVEVTALDRTAAWALSVTATAIAPGEDEDAAHQVWLRPHLSGLIVAGWRPDPQEEAP